MSKYPVAGKVAVVTGAGSGIGRALAIELSRRGARVAGCDVHEAAVKETATLCAGEMHTATVDVGDHAAVDDYVAQVAGNFGVVNQVYNNAGIGFNSTVRESNWGDYQRILRINLDGVIYGTLAFLPHLIASGDGHVVNISSLNGILAQPGLSHYCTAKFGVRGFTETLRTEMLLDKVPVKVSVVHPGGVATNISQNTLEFSREAGMEPTAAQLARTTTYTDKLLKLAPADAARIIADGVEKGRPRIMVGRDARALDILTRFSPTAAGRVAVALERILLRQEKK
ncbi:SDR family NAD(P)-dependent oxidoreductase [Gordonia sp. NPDC003376]